MGPGSRFPESRSRTQYKDVMVEIGVGTKRVQTRALGLKIGGNEAKQLSEYNLRVGFAWDPDFGPKNPFDNFPRGPGNGLIIWSDCRSNPGTPRALWFH